MTIVVILAIIVYLANIQSNKPDSIPLPIVNNAFAQESNSTLQSSQEQTSNNSSLLNVINQTLNGPENVNVTSRDRAANNQTNGTMDNQTIQTANGTNTNGTTAENLNNLLQQQLQPPLQSPFNQLPAAPSQLQQLQQLLQQQPSTLQQEQPPLSPPLNLMPPPSSLSQQPPPLITPPLQQQPSNVLPPPSGPLYPTPPFPTQGFTYQSPTLVTQSSYYDSIGTMHIVGEVINQSPVTARFVEIIATFYNSNNQVIGTDFSFTDPTDLAPGQRAPFEILVPEGSMPMYQLSYYGLRVDSRQP
jgi:hypothetical protein